ncbi:hypothetical protein [Clostridium paraputrificum]|nr:hypothetical protein [Clostridium paraputrificum]
MKLIFFHDCTGNVVRVGLYKDNGKWVKWVSKKEVDKYIEEVESVENVNI